MTHTTRVVGSVLLVNVMEMPGWGSPSCTTFLAAQLNWLGSPNCLTRSNEASLPSESLPVSRAFQVFLSALYSPTRCATSPFEFTIDSTIFFVEGSHPKGGGDTHHESGKRGPKDDVRAGVVNHF